MDVIVYVYSDPSDGRLLFFAEPPKSWAFPLTYVGKSVLTVVPDRFSG